MHKNYFTSEMKKNKGKVMLYSNAYKKVSNPRVPSNLISLLSQIHGSIFVWSSRPCSLHIYKISSKDGHQEEHAGLMLSGPKQKISGH